MQSSMSLLKPFSQTVIPSRRLARPPLSQLPPRLRSSSRPLPIELHPATRWGIRSQSSGSAIPPAPKSSPRGADDPFEVDLSSGRGQLGKIEPKLSLTFTCTVDGCGERSSHEFAKRSYEKGIVLVQCPKCKNRHLIADHLSWFAESTENGKLPTIEDIVKARGEVVRKGRGRGVEREDGTVEYVLDEEEVRP